ARGDGFERSRSSSRGTRRPRTGNWPKAQSRASTDSSSAPQPVAYFAPQSASPGKGVALSCAQVRTEEGPLPLSVLILAAGQGKRLHSVLPKGLQPLAGSLLLAHLVDTASALRPSAIHIVYGHGGARVLDALPAADLGWSYQAEQLSTGHAVTQ